MVVGCQRVTVDSIVRILENVAAANTRDERSSFNLHMNPLWGHFECVSVPEVPLRHVVKVLRGRQSAWVAAFLLIHKLAVLTHMPVTQRNVHRLTIAAFNVAMKVALDVCLVNKHVCKTLNIGKQDLYNMEAAFLTLLDWDVWVNPVTIISARAAMCDIEAAVEQNVQCPTGRIVPLVPKGVVDDVDISCHIIKKKQFAHPHPPDNNVTCVWAGSSTNTSGWRLSGSGRLRRHSAGESGKPKLPVKDKHSETVCEDVNFPDVIVKPPAKTDESREVRPPEEVKSNGTKVMQTILEPRPPSAQYSHAITSPNLRVPIMESSISSPRRIQLDEVKSFTAFSRIMRECDAE
eukprot:Hpha_TRINITY_DN16235_c1_g1::TRINITY_DN16235_c1_g1_i1::g.13647::m.13647